MLVTVANTIPSNRYNKTACAMTTYLIHTIQALVPSSIQLKTLTETVQIIIRVLDSTKIWNYAPGLSKDIFNVD
jgi:hypothetical protein